MYYVKIYYEIKFRERKKDYFLLQTKGSAYYEMLPIYTFMISQL